MFLCLFGLVCGVAVWPVCGVDCLLRLVRCLVGLIAACPLLVYGDAFVMLFVVVCLCWCC